ncbi:hypothetical protein QQS21_010509 [Conoideocrella luteorostrata]|uniref:J domain-containing protein n=1 Tax=Conoideocrella luteorostrata TaxID=1105319 RepID=A0AAJ0FUM0_9HYPO|nr:hypothetical protein QQS21_010509 [Conoideocrella luteorostrata]
MAAQRDYYADLELPRDADINDIKRQFRKLALKYHPDRNPGREQEVNAQFQIIQAANEVLSDQSQKAKYDATLGRSSRYPASSGVRGNPWANVGTQFPTPPRRTNAPRKPQNTQSGAERWQSRFSSGVPPTAKQTFGSDPNAKKNAAKAFENMRKNAQKESRPTEPPPPPPRQPPRTQSARQRAEAAFGSRKSGYYPASTTPGDEPPVSRQNYSNTERRNVPPPPPQRPGPNSMPDPLSQFRDKGSSSESYHGTPYTTHGGEKTNPFDGVPLSDSHSTQERFHTDKRTPLDNETRNSSVPKKSSQDGIDSNTQAPTDANQQGPSADEDFMSHTTTSFKTRADARTNAQPAGHPQSGTTSSEPFAEDGANADDGPSMYDNPYRQNFFNPLFTSMHQFRPTKPDIERMHATAGLESSRTIYQDTSPSGNRCGNTTLVSFERHQTNVLNKLISNKDEILLAPEKKPIDRSVDIPENIKQYVQLADEHQNHSFSFPVDHDTFKESGTIPGGRGFAKSSVDDINTSFTNDEGSNTWQFNAGTGKADANVGTGHSQDGRRHRRPPFKRPSMHHNDSANTAFNAAQTESGFNAEGWSDKFGPQTFAPQPTPGPSASPTRTSRANSKKTKIKPTAGTAATVEEGGSEEDNEEWRGRNAQAQARPAATDSPQAMDIDSPTFSGPSQPPSARNIPVEPSRPEWRAGKFDSVPPRDIPRRPAKIPLDANAAGSEDSEEFRTSLADLKNVAPFSQQKEGLNSFDELKDNLPFESRASGVSPVKLPKTHSLAFPDPPTAPVLHPTVAIEGMKPNATAWNIYLTNFEEYLRKWDEFNGQVVVHFATRQSHTQETRAVNGYGFLAARGDADVQEYYSWVQQDNDVRRRWMDACEGHQNRMREFMVFREKMSSRG